MPFLSAVVFCTLVLGSDDWIVRTKKAEVDGPATGNGINYLVLSDIATFYNKNTCTTLL